MFFAISSFFELLCVLLYAFSFPKLPIVKYYRSKAASEGSKTVSADLAAGGIQKLPEATVCYSVQYLLKKFPKHSCSNVIQKKKRCNLMQDVENRKEPDRLGNKQLLLQNIDYALGMFLIYTLTLSIFPGFLSEDTGSHSLGTWYVLNTIYHMTCLRLGSYHYSLNLCLPFGFQSQLLLVFPP